jgi:hypothetical protein
VEGEEGGGEVVRGVELSVVESEVAFSEVGKHCSVDLLVGFLLDWD